MYNSFATISLQSYEFKFFHQAQERAWNAMETCPQLQPPGHRHLDRDSSHTVCSLFFHSSLLRYTVSSKGQAIRLLSSEGESSLCLAMK